MQPEAAGSGDVVCGNDVIYGNDVFDVLRRSRPAEPVLCLDQALLNHRAKAVVANFGGEICYDVAVNPHPLVLAALAQAGIRRFSVLRVGDLATLAGLDHAVTPVLRQPINSRPNLRIAAEHYGVRAFAVDDPAELTKLRQEVPADGIEVEILVCLSTIRSAGEITDGAADAVEGMVRTAIDFGFRPSIAIHPGISSATDIAVALAYCHSLARRCGVALDAINLGSAELGRDDETIEGLGIAADLHARLLGLDPARLRLDASRMTVDGCCSALAQVLLRKGDAIYLNDGRFGWLRPLDRRLRRNAMPPRLRRLEGTHSAASRRFCLFGPTCDSYDAFQTQIVLPADVREGDWIEFPAMGADTIAWACAFNGLHPSLFAVIAPPNGLQTGLRASTRSHLHARLAEETGR
jgi:ornithine decarboxylase